MTGRLAKTSSVARALVAAMVVIGAPTAARAGGGTQSYSVPYQGRLELNGGGLNGTRALRFSLYPDTNPMTPPSWMEAHTGSEAVVVADGSFSVTLGEITTLTADLLVANPFLGAEVSEDDGASWIPLGGRQLIGSAPYAWGAAPGQDFVATRFVGDGAVPATGARDHTPPYLQLLACEKQ